MKKAMAIGMVVAAVMGGCVDREMVITTEPAGATVTISGLNVGTTPLRKSFTWYGVYDVILTKDGYETMTVAQNVKAPLNQVPPFDFFAELWPATIYDRHEFHYVMKPAKPLSRTDLIKKADALKGRNDQPVPKPHSPFTGGGN